MNRNTHNTEEGETAAFINDVEKDEIELNLDGEAIKLNLDEESTATGIKSWTTKVRSFKSSGEGRNKRCFAAVASLLLIGGWYIY
jgi:hypothetical protein